MCLLFHFSQHQWLLCSSVFSAVVTYIFFFFNFLSNQKQNKAVPVSQVIVKAEEILLHRRWNSEVCKNRGELHCVVRDLDETRNKKRARV